MDQYPVTPLDADTGKLAENAAYIQRLRQSDISDFDNLVNRFMSGRKVGKIPSASNDVSTSDRVGDFNYDASYLYILIDNGGAAWRRASLGSW